MHRSLEDAQVAAAGKLAGVDAILTNDADFLKHHEIACRPQDLLPLLEEPESVNDTETAGVRTHWAGRCVVGVAGGLIQTP